jgi:hypothetical protein
MPNMNKNRMSSPTDAVYPVVPDPDAANDKRPTAEQLAKKAPKMYRATARGYINGTIVDAGDVFATNMEKGSWMDPVGKNSATDDRLASAVDDTQSPLNDDPDLTTFSKQALEAEALRLGLTDAKGLSKDDLITAIRAAYVNEAQ